MHRKIANTRKMSDDTLHQTMKFTIRMAKNISLKSENLFMQVMATLMKYAMKANRPKIPK